MPLPHAGPAELRAAYDFGNLREFPDIYYAVADVLRAADDFYPLALSYMQRAHEQGVVRAEPHRVCVTIDPRTCDAPAP